MIKNIVFDMGGVLVDLKFDKALEAFREMGLEHPENYINPYRQSGVFLQLEEGTISDGEFVREFSKILGREVTLGELQWAWHEFLDKVNVEKLRYVESLRSKYKVYLLSNNNSLVLSWADTPAFSEDGKPISAYFDKMYLSYELHLTKPGREIFDYMIADSGLVPEETLFIDDGPKNIEAGRALGFHVYQPANGEVWCSAVDEILRRNL